MSRDFLGKSNPALDAAIASATDPERIRELVKSNLASAGIISRERGNDYGARVTGSRQAEQPATEVSLPASPAQETCVRVVYPHGNDRFEIFASSEAELDMKEAAIRAIFGQQ